METRSESTAKRARESQQNLRQDSSVEQFENYPKVPRLSNNDKAFFRELIRESEYITAEVIKSSIKDSEEKHFDFIKKLIKESEERILTVIENKIDNVKLEPNTISERVTQLELKSSEALHMKDEIIELKRKILKQENSVVASSIRIAGVPYLANENLNTIFEDICNSLEIPTPQIENIYRLKKIYKDNKPYNPTDEVIVVKLNSPFDKNFLLKTISKYCRNNKTTLCLNQAGFDSNEPFYLNENLTPHNHRIFKKALSMRKERQIKSTFTLRGMVYVKKNDSDDPILIEFIEELDNLFRE